MFGFDSRKVVTSGYLILIALSLAACGGGSGSAGTNSTSSSSSAASSAPSGSLIPSPASVQVSAYVFSTSAATQSISLSIPNAPASANYIAWRYSKGGVSAVTGNWDTPTHAAFTISFKQPSGLAAGTYSDVLRIELCEDASCDVSIAGSVVEIPISYTVVPTTGAGAPAMTLSPQSISAEDPYIGPSGYMSSSRVVDVALNLANFVNAPYLLATHQGAAVGSVSTSASTTLGQVSVGLQSPMMLGRGTYADTVSLKVCLDGPSCVYQAAGSPFQIPVTYVVGDTYTVTGSNGFTWRLVPTAANDIAWDMVSQRIYATESDESDSSLTTGYLTRVNPVTRAIDWRLPLPVFPMRLAISPDGLYAYVWTVSSGFIGSTDPQIRKYQLSDQALMWTISLAGNVSDFQVSPGMGAFLAVSNSSPGLALYSTSTGTLIDSSASSSGFPESITWGGSSSALYSYDTTNDLLRKFSPTSSSLGFVSNTSIDLNTDQAAWGGLHYGNGLLMENHGAIYDVGTGMVSSRLALSSISGDPNFKPYSIAAELDMTIGRSYFWYQNGSAVIMQAFDMNTHAALAFFPTESRSTFRLIRWGTDGLAYLHSGNSAVDSGIGLVQGKFVAP